MSDLIWFDKLISDIVTTEDVSARWQKFTANLAALGFDQINYGFLELGDRMDGEVTFLSSMDTGWLEYYSDRRLDMADHHVELVRGGNIRPYIWHPELTEKVDDTEKREVLNMGVEAGLCSQVQVTLPDSDGSVNPVAGMAIGTSMQRKDFAGTIGGIEAYLITAAHIFHNRSLGQIKQMVRGIAPLSKRERDCLTMLAEGKRIAPIADTLGLARVTVEMHLHRARRKLKAATLHEAVAKALVYKQIAIG